MPKVSKIAVFGAKSVGKTSIIHQIVYGSYTIDKVCKSTIQHKCNVNRLTLDQRGYIYQDTYLMLNIDDISDNLSGC